ncbi:hypothetical protein [Alkalinema sp. FACHB-956]|uniref:hypothetical protein n=1 Tax=Alkalinema sp. FACHB-956 TaxID=2692768 RepID=UPI001681CE54|nr:hypothetical protein [Alkalinema sp. FACHB-956]MBD2326097.1 hypothetical protein [Alkalinema sp. FACHB-956]
MNPAIALIQTVFQAPPKPFDPINQTLKGWAVYCLRDRGFKVVTFSPKADFVVESKSGDLLFKVTQDPESVDPAQVNWIVVARSGQDAQVIPATNA